MSDERAQPAAVDRHGRDVVVELHRGDAAQRGVLLRRRGRAGVRVGRRLAHGTRLLTRAESSAQVLPLEGRHGVMGAHVVAVDRDRDALGAREVLGRGERGAQRIGDDETIGDEATGDRALGKSAVAATRDPKAGALALADDDPEHPRLQLDARDDRPAWCGGARVLAGGGDPSGHVLRSNAGGPPTVPPRPLRRGASRPCRRPRRSRAGRHRVHR